MTGDRVEGYGLKEMSRSDHFLGKVNKYSYICHSGIKINTDIALNFYDPEVL